MRAVVVDTNVFIAIVTGEPAKGPQAQAALKGTFVWAPTTLFTETANVVQKLRRNGTFTEAQADIALDTVVSSVNSVVPVPELWKAAVRLSVMHRHPAFDMLFVALAERENLSLVTFDNPLRTKCPHVCEDPAAFVARP